MYIDIVCVFTNKNTQLWKNLLINIKLITEVDARKVTGGFRGGTFLRDWKNLQFITAA